MGSQNEADGTVNLRDYNHGGSYAKSTSLNQVLKTMKENNHKQSRRPRPLLTYHKGTLTLPRGNTRADKQNQDEKSDERRVHPSSERISDDWICSKCDYRNFKHRETCKKCNKTKNSNDMTMGDVDASGSRHHGSEPRQDVGTTWNNGQGVNPRDWACLKCNTNVYANRDKCWKCHASKPDVFTKADYSSAEGARSATTNMQDCGAALRC